MSESYKRMIVIQSDQEPQDKYNLWLQKLENNYYLWVYDCNDWHQIAGGSGGSVVPSTTVEWTPKPKSNVEVGILSVNGKTATITTPQPKLTIDNMRVSLEYGNLTSEGNIRLPFTIRENTENNTLEFIYNGIVYIMNEADVQPGPGPQPPQKYEVRLKVSPTDAGTVTGAGEYEEGEQCEIEATANEGYKFSNWRINGSNSSVQNPYVFDVLNNTYAVAFFTETGGSGSDDDEDDEDGVAMHSITPKLYIDGSPINEDYTNFLDITGYLSVEDGGSTTLILRARNSVKYYIYASIQPAPQNQQSTDEIVTLNIPNITSDMDIYVYLTTREYGINITHLNTLTNTQLDPSDFDRYINVGESLYSRQQTYKYGQEVNIRYNGSSGMYECTGFRLEGYQLNPQSHISYTIGKINNITALWEEIQLPEHTITTEPLEQQDNQ